MATFTNRATLSYNGGSTDSNTVTGTLLETLSAAKNASVDTYSDGSDITYVLSLVNTGTTPFTGLTMTDDLGGYDFGGTTVYPLDYIAGSLLYYVNGVLQPTPTVTAGPPLTVTGISVPAGGDAVIVYSATTNAGADPAVGGEIVNTVTVTGGGLAEPLTATETVTAEEGTALFLVA